MYNENIMRLALEIANLSPDPTTKVGSVITNLNNEILSVGYNQLKKYIPVDDIEYINNNKSTKKYAFLHAEMMALSRLKDTDEELSIYITHPSCINCVVELVLNNKYKFKNLYYIHRGSQEFMERYCVKDAIELLKYKKINIVTIHESDIDIEK